MSCTVNLTAKVNQAEWTDVASYRRDIQCPSTQGTNHKELLFWQELVVKLTMHAIMSRMKENNISTPDGGLEVGKLMLSCSLISTTLIEFFLHYQQHIRFFHSLHKVGRNGSIGIKGFNNGKKKVTSSGARPEIITGLGVQCLTNSAKLVCVI